MVLSERGMNMQNLKDTNKSKIFYNDAIDRKCEKPIPERKWGVTCG